MGLGLNRIDRRYHMLRLVETGKVDVKASHEHAHYLEGQGDLLSRLITPITHIVTPIIPIINLIIKSP